jgi:hypothetical protein
MTVFSSTQPSIRARVLPRFPANVLAGTGISITKSGGTYVFATTAIVDLPVTSLQNIPADTLLGRDTNGVGDVELLTVSGGLGMTGAGSIELVANQRIRAFPFTITGAPITTGVKGDLFVPFSGSITRVTLLADQNTGATPFVLDLWKAGYASYPPTVANTITAAAKPTILAGAAKGQTTVLTGWTTALTAGDVIRFNVDSTSTVTRVYVGLDVNTV